jgi:hypothetical protein
MATGLSEFGEEGSVARAERIAADAGKYLKLIAFIGFSGLFWGCGSHAIVPPAHDEMIQLEEKNSRLEAEVTELREKILAEQRLATGCADKPLKTAPSPESDINKQPPELGELADDAPELAVVRLQPDAASEETEADPDFGQNVSSPGDANSDEPIDDSTRPVLKVHGRHEARVYHRPLDAADGPPQ